MLYTVYYYHTSFPLDNLWFEIFRRIKLFNYEKTMGDFFPDYCILKNYGCVCEGELCNHHVAINIIAIIKLENRDK